MFASLERSGIVAVLVLLGLSLSSCDRSREITEVKRRINRQLLLDESGKRRPDVYAEKITFPKVTVAPAEDNALRMDFIVRNGGDEKVTYLEVTISLLDEEGIQVAGRIDLFAHDGILGENNTPILPQSAKRAGCEVQNAGDWKDGKIVVTIERLTLE